MATREGKVGHSYRMLGKGLDLLVYLQGKNELVLRTTAFRILWQLYFLVNQAKLTVIFIYRS